MRPSIIHSLETDYKASIEALFDRICPAFVEQDDQLHPPVKLRYMIDDYQELLYPEKTDKKNFL